MEREPQSPVRVAWPAIAVGLGALGVLYAPLLNFEAHLPEPREIEGWLFQVGSGTPTALIVAIGLWLLWRRRARVVAVAADAGTPVLGSALLALATAIAGWAHFTVSPDLLVPSLMLAGFGVAAVLGGPALMRVVVVPVGFLLFAVKWPAPLVNQALWLSQLATAQYAGAALDAVGFPAFVSGEQILQADKSFAIIEACAGLKTVETMTMLAVLMADLFRRTGWRAVVIIALAPPVAFTMNAVRSIVLMLSAQSVVEEVVDLQGALMHNVQGISMLLVGLTLIYLVDGALERRFPVRRPPAPPRPAARSVLRSPPARVWALAAWAAAAALVVTLAPAHEPASAGRLYPSSVVPEELGSWTGSSRQIDRMFLGTVDFRAFASRLYERRGSQALVFVGADDPLQRFTSGYSPKTLRPGSGWMVEDHWQREVPGTDLTVEVVVARRGPTRLLVYHWRQAWGGLAAESLRTALALDRSPFARDRDLVVVRLAAPLTHAKPEDVARAEAELDSLVLALGPALDRL